MSELEGMDQVDPEERKKQAALTESLWLQLENQGIKEGAPGRIECIFFAGIVEATSALLPAFDGWEHEVVESSAPGEEYLIRVISPLVHLSKVAFLELVDVSLIAASESRCRFDGLQVETSGLKKRPWWKFW